MINQTRTLLVVALLAVAYLLWQAWQHDYPATPPPAPAQVAASSTSAADEAAVPTASATVAPALASATAAAAPPPETASTRATPKQDLITASNDLLKLTIDPRGGTVIGAALLKSPQKVERGSPPVQRLTDSTATYDVAQEGLIGADGSTAPNHLATFKPACELGFVTVPKDSALQLPPYGVSLGTEHRDGKPL